MSLLLILKVIIDYALTYWVKQEVHGLVISKYIKLQTLWQIFKEIWFFSFSGHSQELHSMLHNRHLREMIREIDSSEDPGKLLSQAMQIPIFTEFADECLRIVEPQDES